MSARHPKTRRRTARSVKADGPSLSRSWHRLIDRLRENQPTPLNSLGTSKPEIHADEAATFLQSFPPEELEFLRLFYVQEWSLQKISEVIGITVPQVYLLKARSKTRFEERETSRHRTEQNLLRTPTPETILLYRDLQKLQAPLLLRAFEVFGAAPRAIAWLQEPNPALGNISPLDGVLYQDSRTEVFNILGRIEHGVLS